MTVDTERALGRLEGKLDLLLSRLPDYDERLRDVETRQAHQTGRQSVISTAVSVVVAGLTAWLTKHFA